MEKYYSTLILTLLLTIGYSQNEQFECVSGDCDNGYCSMKIEEITWRGQCKNKLPNGEGLLLYPEGNMAYEGTVINGEVYNGIAYLEDSEKVYIENYYDVSEKRYFKLDKIFSSKVTTKLISHGSGSSHFKFYCPLTNKGFELQEFANYSIPTYRGNSISSSGLLSGSKVKLHYDYKYESFVLEGEMKEGKFIGAVSFGILLNTQLNKTGITNFYKVINHLNFKNNGTPFSLNKTGFLNIVICGIESGISEIVHDDVLSPIITEVVSSTLRDRNYSSDNVSESILLGEIVKELENDGHFGSAKAVNIGSFIKCVLDNN